MSEAKEYPIDCLKWIGSPLNENTARILIGEFEDLSRQVGYLNAKSNEASTYEAEYLEARGRQLRAMESAIRLIVNSLAPQPLAPRGDLPRFSVKGAEGVHYVCDDWAVGVIAKSPDYWGAIGAFEDRDTADSVAKYLNKHESHFATPAKSPFAEWAGVPVTVENLRPMSFWGMIDGSDSESVFYLNYSKWDISVSIRRDRIMLGLPDVSYSIHPRDIAHLLEIISGFDPQAFEKGGEG